MPNVANVSILYEHDPFSTRDVLNMDLSIDGLRRTSARHLRKLPHRPGGATLATHRGVGSLPRRFPRDALRIALAVERADAVRESGVRSRTLIR